MCGEQPGSYSGETFPLGSSPRVRGTADQPGTTKKGSRFIPACAGNRSPARRGRQDLPVHPRVCGEQSLPLPSLPLPSGSSPRVRGTVISKIPAITSDRFIPACAGNRNLAHSQIFGVTVHPRVCGEQHGQWLEAFIQHGSSPRVRGTGILCGTSVSASRFIPACAGNSLPDEPTPAEETVHPRVCGEQILFVSGRPVLFGSSPRVRGTGAGAGVVVQCKRFIPACAGNR